MESVGFKEWAAVCEAMGRGRQSIILRKGGIAEGREGFSFKYPEFFLFPTWFHEQPQKVRADCGIDIPAMDHGAGSPGNVEIKYAARLEVSRTITSWENAAALEPLHILRPEVVRERFEYDEAPGLHVAFVRVFRLKPSWAFPDEKRYGGCRSWVKLPDLPNNIALEPVLADVDHQNRKDEFLGIVSAVGTR